MSRYYGTCEHLSPQHHLVVETSETSEGKQPCPSTDCDHDEYSDEEISTVDAVDKSNAGDIEHLCKWIPSSHIYELSLIHI